MCLEHTPSLEYGGKSKEQMPAKRKSGLSLNSGERDKKEQRLHRHALSHVNTTGWAVMSSSRAKEMCNKVYSNKNGEGAYWLFHVSFGIISEIQPHIKQLPLKNRRHTWRKLEHLQMICSGNSITSIIIIISIITIIIFSIPSTCSISLQWLFLTFAYTLSCDWLQHYYCTNPSFQIKGLEETSWPCGLHPPQGTWHVAPHVMGLGFLVRM